MSTVSYSIHQHVGIMSINNPPLNLLSHELREDILNQITKAQSDTSKALVIICQGRTFCAGADIKEFYHPSQSPSLPDLIATIEASKKPVIASLHGSVLGGGLNWH